MRKLVLNEEYPLSRGEEAGRGERERRSDDVSGSRRPWCIEDVRGCGKAESGDHCGEVLKQFFLAGEASRKIDVRSGLEVVFKCRGLL